MKAFMATGAGGKAMILALGAALTGGAGWGLWQAGQPVTAEGGQAAVAAGPSVMPQEAAEAGAQGEAASELSAAGEPVTPVATPAVTPPEITIWAVTETGSATIAGFASPGAEVVILRDQAEIARARASASGEFALVTELAASEAPSLLSLAMILADGERIAGGNQIVLGPVRGPEPASDIASDIVPETYVDTAPAAGEGAVVSAAAAGSADARADMAGVALAATGGTEIGAEAATEAAPPLALMVTEEGAVVLHLPASAATAGASADSPASVVIETISYPSVDLVQIGGSGSAGAFVRLYLNNQPVGAEAQISAAGRWLVSLSAVVPGIYTLRVDQLDAAGQVTARFETPFRRETPEALALAAGLSPAGTAPDLAGGGLLAENEAPLIILPGQTASGAEAGTEAGASPAPGLSGGDQLAAVSAGAPQPPPPVTMTVQPGHSLWAIAQDEWGQGMLYVQLWEANRDKIRDPDLIYPGQIFTLPAAAAP